MPKFESYSAELLASPDLLRSQLRNADVSYWGTVHEDQWELRTSAEELEACLPETIYNFFKNRRGKIPLPINEARPEGLRVIGYTRLPTQYEHSYDKVVEMSFKGTTHECDWMTNFSLELVPAQIGAGEGQVQVGYQSAYLLVREKMQEALEKSCASASADNILVYLSGHSLGGSLATLAAYDLACSKARQYTVRLTTFGCPRVGDIVFATACASAVPNIARFINKLDPIACLPPNDADPNGNPDAAFQILLATPVGHVLDAPMLAVGAVGFCHVAPGEILDPETSKTAHFLVGGLKLAMAEEASSCAGELLNPHDLKAYWETMEIGLRRVSGKAFRRLPSVGTWLQPRQMADEESSSILSMPDSTSRETQELLEYAIALLRDLERAGAGPNFLTDFSWHLAEVLEHGVHLLDSGEGAEFLREAQLKMLEVLPILAATSEKADFSSKVLKQLRRRPSGRLILQKGTEQMRAAASNPDMLKDWVTSLNVSNVAGTSLKDKCISIAGIIKAYCLDFFNNHAAQQLLLAVGVEIDDNIGIQLQHILDKRELLLDSPLGAKILRVAQERVLSMMSGLEAIASNQMLSKQSELYLLELEASERGKELLAWGREQLNAARNDPTHLQTLFASLDEKSIEYFREWCTSLILKDSQACDSVVSSARQRCLDLLHGPSARNLLRKVGVDVDGDKVNLTAVIEKSQQLMETPQGVEILRAVQAQLLEMLTKVESKMDDAGYIDMLEKTEEGRRLLNWGRSHLEQAQCDPLACKTWLGAAESFTCANPQEGFVKIVTNQIWNFLLAQIPLVKVPDVLKEKDGCVFTLANIIIGKCDVKKDHIEIKISKATSSSVTPLPAAVKQQNPCQLNTRESTEVLVKSEPQEASAALMLHLQSMKAKAMDGAGFEKRSGKHNRIPTVSVPKSKADASQSPYHAAIEETFRVTVRNVAVELPDLVWTFQQKDRFPFFQDEGSAKAHANGICIVLGFGLRRHDIDGKVVPYLSLSSHSVVINDFKLEMKEAKLSWLYNTAVWWFEQAVKEYVICSLQDALLKNVESWLISLNGRMHLFWPFLLKRVGISRNMLPSAALKPPELENGQCGLLLCISSAQGLSKLNRSGDRPWCSCELQSPTFTPTGIQCSTKVVPGTLFPEWGETHLLAPWHRGENLLFTVYDQGLLASKMHGSCAMPGNWFYPTAFEGSLKLGRCDVESKLSVSVSVVLVEEYSADIIQGVGPLGVQVDPNTLAVKFVTADGRMEESCFEEGLSEVQWIQPGDYLACVDCQDFSASPIPVTSANLKHVLDAIEMGSIARLSWRRAMGNFPSLSVQDDSPK